MENPSDHSSRKVVQERIQKELQRRREEARRLNQAEAQERERERLFAPSPPSEPSEPSESSEPSEPMALTEPSPSPTQQKPSKNAGWDQGDGRRADQVSVYESALPDAVRARLVPAKGTHFRFRNPSDEQALLDALSSPGQTATYQATGKKDVTITSADGQLLGNIHFLHMDGRDIHRPEKYYMKFYLFNFSDANILRDAKQRLLHFAQSFSSRPARPAHPSRRNRPSPPARSNLNRLTRNLRTRRTRRWRPTRRVRRNLK